MNASRVLPRNPYNPDDTSRIRVSSRIEDTGFTDTVLWDAKVEGVGCGVYADAARTAHTAQDALDQTRKAMDNLDTLCNGVQQQLDALA